MKSRRIMILMLLAMSITAMAATGKWRSTATGTDLKYKTSEPSSALKDKNGKVMTIVYLENLACEKIGRNSNAEDVAWLLGEGYRVVEIDYAGNRKAVSPAINLDIIAINDLLNSGTFCGCKNISPRQSYILFEGYRIRRDVGYYLDDPAVYNLPDGYTVPDSLYMDIVYPANASTPVPTLLSFSYSNCYHGNEHGRMFLGYTFSMFDDSVLEGAPARGMAWAIADHPKYCDWGNGKYQGGANKSLASIEIAVDAARKVKSAVRAIRGTSKDSGLGLGDDVFVYGFSRGSTAASLAIGDAPFESWMSAERGVYPSASSEIQAAVLGPGVFDYSIMPTDTREYRNMVAYLNAVKTWPAAECYGGAIAIRDCAAPCFLFYNTDDETYYDGQMKNLTGILTSKGVKHEVLKNFGKGHSVPQKPEHLARIYDFLTSHIYVPASIQSPSASSSPDSQNRTRCRYSINGAPIAPDEVTHGIYIDRGRKFLNALRANEK